jgi:hypothetical protein
VLATPAKRRNTASEAYERGLASARLGMPLPKRASQQVIEAARHVVERYGARERLGEVPKLSFRTTEKVLARERCRRCGRDRTAADTGGAGGGAESSASRDRSLVSPEHIQLDARGRRCV